MPRQHTASNATDLVHSIDIEAYKFRFEYESLRCIHCGDSMYDYYDLEDWPYGFQNFADAHESMRSWIDEFHGMERDHPHLILSGDITDRQSSLHICRMCGWWTAMDRAVLPAMRWQMWLVNLAAPASLMDLDVSDLSTPLQEIRSFLRRRYDARHHVPPRLFEQVVASVFSDMGYDAEATAYSNDGGIDVVLRDKAGQRVGVQVKRRGRHIEAEQIRAFQGALMLGGFTRGVFVSTSGFQCGTLRTAKACRPWAGIELMDPERFFDALGIAQFNRDIDPDTCGFYSNAGPPAFLHSSFHLNAL